MGLSKFERAMFYSALRNHIVNTPFGYAYRIPLHEPRSEAEPADRQDYEIDILEDNPKGEETIYEIKDQADAKAIGQLFLYEYLLKMIPQYSQKKINKAILCTSCPMEIKGLAGQLNIRIEVLDKPIIDFKNVPSRKVSSLKPSKRLDK